MMNCDILIWVSELGCEVGWQGGRNFRVRGSSSRWEGGRELITWLGQGGQEREVLIDSRLLRCLPENINKIWITKTIERL